MSNIWLASAFQILWSGLHPLSMVRRSRIRFLRSPVSGPKWGRGRDVPTFTWKLFTTSKAKNWHVATIDFALFTISAMLFCFVFSRLINLMFPPRCFYLPELIPSYRLGRMVLNAVICLRTLYRKVSLYIWKGSTLASKPHRDITSLFRDITSLFTFRTVWNWKHHVAWRTIDAVQSLTEYWMRRILSTLFVFVSY